MASWLHWRMTWSPSIYIRNVGTCGVTLPDNGKIRANLPDRADECCLWHRRAVREPVVRGDEIVIGRILKCTLMVDNFVISGLTGGKLAQAFKEALETGAVIRQELEHAWGGS